MKKLRRLKKGLAVVLSAAMLAGLMPGMETMKVSAAENGSGTESISSVKLSAISGTQGATDEDYDKLIDGKYSNSKWCVTDFSGAYIIFSASEAGYVTGYSITTGNDNEAEHGRNPKNWKLYGCNDPSADRDSTSWVEIHSVKNDKVLQDENYKTYDYELDSLMAEKYQYFKLEITANQGASVMQMSEFTLKYSSCDHQWSDTGEVVGATCTEKAYKVQQCSKCNGTAKLYTGDALGHDFVEGQCSRCDAIQYQKVNYLDKSGESSEVTCYVITETSDSLSGTEVEPGWYVVKDDVTIDNRITIDGNVHLVLADNSSLTVNGGIEVSDGNSLSIYAQSKGTGMGSLIVQNVAENDAGIGSGKNNTGGNITIAGGKVTSNGGGHGAGIGGGFQAEGGNICITGGIVTANGTWGAGIGVGATAMGAKVIISGGIVRATGNNGIGFGMNCPEEEYSVTFATQGETDSPSGNAVIFAESSGYGAGISDTTGKDISWSGVIFEGNSGKVYGSSVTPTQSFTIDRKTLTIDSGKTLTIPSGVTLDNQGSFIVKGRVINYSDTDVKGTIEDNGKIHQDLNHDGVCDNCTSEGICSYFDNVTVSDYSNTVIGKEGKDITLSASVTPKTTEQTVTYQWYEKSAEDTYTAVNKATGSSCVVKKDTKGTYEYRLEAVCDGVVRWIPFTVEVTCACLAYENGFCTICGGYEPATKTTGQYDINGDGQKDAGVEVYEISNPGQLYWFAGLVNGTLTDGTNQNTAAKAVLTADITVNKGVDEKRFLDSLVFDEETGEVSNGGSFRSWTPVGDTDVNAYTGTFDGQGFTVSGLYFNDTSTGHVGLFGCVGSGGNVSNVGVVDSYFNGHYRVGGVCGTNDGEITNCYNTGEVSGTGNCVGGVCGYNGKGEITNCYNTGTVSGTGNDVGGVCGANYSTITNSYYLDSKETDSIDGTTFKTTEQFAGGEVAYLLQSGQTAEENEDIREVWGQKLGENGDAYPVLGGTKVYQNITYSDCGKTEISKTEYSNTDIPDVIPPHEYKYAAENSVITEKCSVCSHSETATLELSSNPDLTYTGEEITPVAVTYSEGWQGSKELTVNYDNNINAGPNTAKASITINGAKAELNFSIGKAELLPSEVNLKKDIYLEPSETGTKTLTATDLFDADMPAGARIEGYTKTADENAIISDGSTVENGVFSYTPAVSAEKVGKEATYEFTVSSKNYNDITVTVTFQVKEKNTVSITGVSVDNKTYDGKAMSYTGTPSALWNGTSVSVAFTCTWQKNTDDGTWETISEAPVNAGKYRLIVAVADSEPEYKGSLAPMEFTIEKKKVTVAPLNQSIYAKTSNDGDEYKGIDTSAVAYKGFIGTDNDNNAAIISTAAVVCNVTDYTTAGTYKDVLSIGDVGALTDEMANNYELVNGGTATLNIVSTAYNENGGNQIKLDGVSSGIVTMDTVQEADLPKTEIGSLTKPLVKALLGETDALEVNNGTNALIYLDVTNAKDEVTAEEKTKIAAAVGSGFTVADTYLDLSLYKKVGNTSATKLTDLNGNKIKVEIQLPENMRPASTVTRTFTVIRMHEEKAEALAAIYDTKKKTLVFETDKFSVYAIAYQDAENSTGGGGSTSGGGGSTSGGGSSSGGGGSISNVPVTGITVTPENATLTKAGESLQLTAEVSPSYATNKNITWTSDNEAVATVDSTGKVTAVGNGTATITATTQSGSKTATVAITVNIASGDNDNPSAPADTDRPSIPVETDKPSVVITPEPITPAETEKPSVSVTPDVTVTPAVPTPSTEPNAPVGSDTPKDTAAPEVSATPTVTATPTKVTSDFGTLKARSVKQTKTTVTLKWAKVSKADGYLIYGSKCNTKGQKYTVKLLKTIKGNGTFTWTQKKLAKATFYKYQIKAYKLVDGKKVIIAQSVDVHVTTKGGKYSVAGAIKVTKLAGKKVSGTSLKLTVTKGKTAQIKASQTPAEKNKTIKCHRALCYESSNKKVATVTKSGKIKAVGKGTCKIYVYAQNGVYKTITVTVK